MLKVVFRGSRGWSFELRIDLGPLLKLLDWTKLLHDD